MKKCNIITNFVCVVISIACVILTFWGNLKNDGVLTPDAFIGTCIALIGVCTTIIVGFQIASHLDIHDTKKQMESVKAESEKVQKDKKEIQEKIEFLRTNLSNAFVMLSETTENSAIRSLADMSAIYCDSPQNIDNEKTLKRYISLRDNLKRTTAKDRKTLSTQVDRLRSITLNNIKYYQEIVKLHFEVIDILEKAAKEQNG